jgi:D-alanine-D-alanine ligase-like ATP-grasp enzyme
MRIQTGAFNVLASDAPRGKSTFEVLQVAHRLSIPYRPLAGGVFQLGWGRHARLIHRSTTDHDSAIGLHLTRDKHLTAQMLRQAGLPAPEHQPVSSLAQAQTWAQRIGYPVVVKPSDMERGEGVAVDVTEAGLEAAFQSAQKISPSKSVLIERQVPGVCHRLFITQGQLLYAVKRLPMGVYGDGTSSIGELAQAAHAAQMQRPPWMRSGVSSLHPLPLAFLQQQGWSATDVPAAGQFVALRRIESTAWGGVDEDVTHTVHPDNVSAAVRAAQLLRLEVAGVDLISTDITQAWHSNGAVINEVNYAPLLGGGEISRSHIASYLSRMLKNQGKIPIKTIQGGENPWAQGLAYQQRLIAMGEAAFLTNHQHTLDPQGHTYPMATEHLDERVQALLMNREVGALVLVI